MPEFDDDDKKMMLVLPEGEFEFDPDRYLTRSHLSHIKGWFPNSDLWQYWGFQQALGVGDPDAVACAMWMVRRKEGFTQNNPEPRSFARKIGAPDDFSVGKVIIAPNRRPDLDPPRWQLKLDEDEEYTLDMDEHVTCAMLRQIAKWYSHLGTFAGLYIQLLRGDPDAVACAIWLVRTVHGVQPNPNPREMDDFSVGVVSASPNLSDVFDEPVSLPKETTGSSPKAGTPTKDITDSSTETQTNSGLDGSPASPITALE